MTTEKQHSFILSLLDTRQVETYVEGAIRKTMNGFTNKEASNTIDYLKSQPVKVTVEVKEVSALDRYIAAITPVPVAKYAISRERLTEILPDREFRNDFLFFEVSEYRGRKLFKRLTGAPGFFTRLKMPFGYSLPILAELEKNWREHSVAFAKHYNVCGRCAAELTDQKSRELSFGPHCAKMLGIS